MKIVRAYKESCIHDGILHHIPSLSVYQPPKLHQHIIMEDTSKAPKASKSTKVPKAFSDVVPGDVVWAQIVIPKGAELVTSEKKPSKNSTQDR